MSSLPLLNRASPVEGGILLFLSEYLPYRRPLSAPPGVNFATSTYSGTLAVVLASPPELSQHRARTSGAQQAASPNPKQQVYTSISSKKITVCFYYVE